MPNHKTIFSIVAMTSFIVAGSQLAVVKAQAQTPVPQTGSAQGVNTPNSLPGGSAAFGSSPSSSSTPMSAAPPSGAAQGVVTAPAGQTTGTVSGTTTRP